MLVFPGQHESETTQAWKRLSSSALTRGIGSRSEAVFCGQVKRVVATCRNREHFESNGEAKMELFDYIEVFYNQRRRHSTLGQISPAAFERCAAA